MVCTNCHRDIADASNFCYYCGVRQAPVPPAGSTPWAGKRLMRSATDVKLAGVCAGFAEYLDWDVTLVRLLWAILTLFSGCFPGVVGYIICWIVMPVAPLPHPKAAPNAEPTAQSAQTA
jgi:phage shock protein C